MSMWVSVESVSANAIVGMFIYDAWRGARGGGGSASAAFRCRRARARRPVPRPHLFDRLVVGARVGQDEQARLFKKLLDLVGEGTCREGLSGEGWRRGRRHGARGRAAADRGPPARRRQESTGRREAGRDRGRRRPRRRGRAARAEPRAPRRGFAARRAPDCARRGALQSVSSRPRRRRAPKRAHRPAPRRGGSRRRSPRPAPLSHPACAAPPAPWPPCSAQT